MRFRGFLCSSLSWGAKSNTCNRLRSWNSWKELTPATPAACAMLSLGLPGLSYTCLMTAQLCCPAGLICHNWRHLALKVRSLDG